MVFFFTIIDQLTAGKIPRNSHKVEASSENNAASSDFATSLQKNKDCSEKGSDVQVSIRSLNYHSCRNMQSVFEFILLTYLENFKKSLRFSFGFERTPKNQTDFFQQKTKKKTE